jgi:hypothetical protein
MKAPLNWMMTAMVEAKMTQLEPPFIKNKSSKLNISFINNRKIGHTLDLRLSLTH